MNTILKRSALFLSALALIFSSCSKQVAYNPLGEPKAAQYAFTNPGNNGEQTVISTPQNEVALVEVKESNIEKPAAEKPKNAYNKVRKNASVLLVKTVNKVKQADKKQLVNEVAQVLPVFARAKMVKNKAAIDGNLRYAIIFFLLALLAGVLANFFGLIFGLLSSILAIIGIVFLVLWILTVL